MEPDILELVEPFDLSDKVSVLTLLGKARHGADIVLGIESDDETLTAAQRLVEEYGLFLYRNGGRILFSDDADWLRRRVERKMSAGEFFGYPRCCVEGSTRYARGHIDDVGCEYVGYGERYLLDALFALRNHRYPAALDYRLHVPCDVRCIESIAMGKRIKAVLESFDKGIARQWKRRHRGMLERRLENCET
jgi:hypothetical protein